MKIGERHIHHNRNGTQIRNSSKPPYNPLLRARPGKIPRRQTQPPLTSSLLCTLQLLNHLFNVLRGCTRNNRIIRVPRIIVYFPDTRQNLKSFFVCEMDSFSCRAKDYEASDARFGEVDGMCGLRCEVDRCSSGVVVGGFAGDEEGWDGDVDPCRRWACHCYER